MPIFLTGGIEFNPDRFGRRNPFRIVVTYHRIDKEKSPVITTEVAIIGL